MKKIVLSMAMLMGMAALNAQVTRGTVGEGTYTNWDNQTSFCEGLDFNNDGVLEFALMHGYDMNTGEEIANGAVQYVYSSNNNVHTDADMWDYFKLLNSGDQLSSASAFNGQGDCYFEDYAALSQPRYVGFRVSVGGSLHYGYAKVSYSSNAVNWHEIYYNATAGAAITVGQTSGGGTQGIDEVEANRFVVAAMDGHRINVMQQGAEQIYVFDLAGRKVAATNSQNSVIELPAAGVYVVRSATATAKIAVM